MVVMILVMVRQNLGPRAAGDLFGVSQPTVSRGYRHVLPLVGQALCLPVPQLSEAVATGSSWSTAPTCRPATALAIGATTLKRHHAGLSIPVAAAIDHGLRAVSEPLPGCVHDRTACTECDREKALRNTPAIADLEYQGRCAVTPRKKPPGGELSVGDKADNKTISSIRSAVQRCLAHLKNWEVLATGYRGRLAELPNVIRIITVLEFYRLGW